MQDRLAREGWKPELNEHAQSTQAKDAKSLIDVVRQLLGCREDDRHDAAHVSHLQRFSPYKVQPKAAMSWFAEQAVLYGTTASVAGIFGPERVELLTARAHEYANAPPPGDITQLAVQQAGMHLAIPLNAQQGNIEGAAVKPEGEGMPQLLHIAT